MILHAAVALVVAGALQLQPPHRTSFAKFSEHTVEACLRNAQRTPQALVADARVNRLALNPAWRDRAIAALEALAEQLARARQLAAEVGDPLLRALVDIVEGWEAYTRGDHGRAHTLFDGAREVVLGGPSGFLESLAWEGTAALAIQLGQEREAVRALHRWRIGNVAGAQAACPHVIPPEVL